MSKLQTKTSGIIVFSDYKYKRFKVLYFMLIFVLVALVAISIFPLIWLFFSSFKEAEELFTMPFKLFPNKLDLTKALKVWQFLDFSKYYINSLIVVLGAVVASVFINGLTAYALEVLRPKGHRVIFSMILLSMLVPAITNMVPLYSQLVNFGFINSYVPLWLMFGANAFYLILFKTYYSTIPKALFEAAQIDGANKLQVFYYIVLPLAKPIASVVAIFTVNAAWSDFLLPYLLLTDDARKTVMVKIYALQSNMGTMSGFGPDKLLMVLLFSIIPTVIIFMFFQRQLTESVATTGLKE